MMENSWKTKCSSTLQSSALSMASSSSQEHRNRMETNTGYYSYPHGSQDLRPTMIGRLQDPLLASKLYSGSHRSEHANLGNSFLALLSGSSSVFQCDFQELSNPKPISTSCKILPDSNNFIVNGIGSAIPVTSSGVLSENLNGQNLQSGADSCTKVSSRSVPSSSCASNSVLHDLQSSDLAKVVTRNMVLGSEKVKGSFSLSGEWHGVSPADTGKACGANIQTSKKLPVEGNFVISNQASSFMNGCPRVFCSTTSGYLLLSNTGLVGIVCSCHCLHMSVLKFCEHSGLYGVNPGHAVRMDNGETIAQWCKLYFLNSGIRVPGDRSEWDWPEGLSATAGLVKSSLSMPNMSNDLSHMVCSSGGSASSQQSLDGVALSKNLFTNQNLVVGAVENKQQRNIQDGNTIFLKGFTGTPQSNLHGMADNLILERPISMSKLVGSGLQDGGQSVSAYVESMKNGNSSIIYPAMKIGNSSITDPSLKDRRIMGKGSNFCRTVNAKDGAFRDAAISNIELRLGQPYQLGQSSGNSNPPAVGPLLLDTLVNPLKSLFPEQMIPNTNCREEMEFRQSLYFSAVPSASTKSDHKQLNRGNNAFVIGNAIDAARVEKSTSNLGQDSVISFLTNLNAPPEDNTRPKASKYICNVGEHAMQNTLHYEPQSAKYGIVNVPRNGSNSVERQLDMSQLGSYRLIDKDKGVSFVTDDSHLSKDLGFRNRKEMEISSSFNGLSGTSDPRFLTAHKNSCYSHQLSGVAPDGPDSRKYSNFPDKVLYFGNRGQVGHVNHRPLASSVGSGQTFPSRTVSKGIPLVSASISVSDQTPALSRENLIEVSTQLPDDNSRLLALREIMELSKQHHALPSLPMNRGKGIFDCSSYMQNSLVDTSASGKQERKLSLTSKNAVSEATIKSHQSGASCRIGSDEGFTSLTGVNTCCHFSTLKQGNALHSKEVDLKHQISFVPLCNEQPSLRSGKNIIEPSEHERCCHKVPYGYFRGSCSCAASINCLGRDFESRVGCFPDAFKEQMGTVNGEASMIFAPKFANNHIVPKDKTTSLDPRGQVNGKIPKNVCHASQWKDVPSKVKGVSDVTRVDRLANLFDARRRDREQLGDNYVNHFNGTVQMVDSSKEHEIYNTSSGGSAPAVTQASIEVNKMDSSTVDAGDIGCVSNLVVDEGSGVDKCWSSDDALESEKSAEFLTSTGNTSLRKGGSFKNLNHQSSCSLLDELKLLNSLTWLKGQNKLPAGLALHEKNEYPQNFERGLEDGKKKREMGSESYPTSGPYTVHEENPECNDNAQFPSCPSKSVKTLFPLRQSITHTFGTCVTQPSSKPRLPKTCLAKKLSRKRDLRRLYDDNDREVNDVNQTELNGGTDNCEISKVSGGNKCKRDFSSNGFRQFLTQESGHEGARKRKHNSVGLKSCSSQQVNICYRKARPIVCGKYGELANGNFDGDMPKPAKVVPLSRVLNSARRCTLPKNCNPKSTSMRELKKTSPNGAVVSSDVCHNDTGCGKINDTPMEKAKKECSVGDKKIRKELTKLEHLGDDQSEKEYSKLGGIAHAQLKLKSKEIRKRSIYELTDKGKDPSFESSSFSKISNCLPANKEGRLLKTAEDSKLGLCKLSSESSTLEHQCHSDLDSDAFCCVCGSSNKDDINNLLTCSQCSTTTPFTLSHHSQLLALEALKRFQNILKSYKINKTHVRCVATAAVREAVNNVGFLKCVREEVGLEIDVLPGEQEARLEYLGMLQFFPIYEKLVLGVDIGGGSTEFVIGKQGQVIFGASLKLGHVNLTQKFGNNEENVAHMREHIRLVVQESGLVEKIKDCSFEAVVGSSGTIKAVEKAALYGYANVSNMLQVGNMVSFGDSKRYWKLSRGELKGVVESLCGGGEAEKIRREKFFKMRSEFIVAGAVLLEEIFEVIGIEEMEISGYSLAEGVIAETLAKVNDYDLNANAKWSSIVRLAMRFNSNKRMRAAAQCASIAKEFFECLRKCDELASNQVAASLDDKDLEYLEASCLLHNIGLSIEKKGYHKHSYSIIMNGGHLQGYSTEEVKLIALLARHHRKKLPNFGHVSFKEFPTEVKKKFRFLCAIIRISVALQQHRRIDFQQIEFSHSYEGFKLVCGGVKVQNSPPCILEPLAEDIGDDLRQEFEHFKMVFHEELLLLVPSSVSG